MIADRLMIATEHVPMQDPTQGMTRQIAALVRPPVDNCFSDPGTFQAIFTRQEYPMAQSPTKTEAPDPVDAAKMESEIAYLVKRHRVTPGIVREIIRRVGSFERAAVEREISNGKARR
jgi:hypothetical protein